MRPSEYPVVRSPTPTSVNSNSQFLNENATPTVAVTDSVNIPAVAQSSTASASVAASAASPSYNDQIINLTPTQIDYKTVSKHLVHPEDSLKQQGGDITRDLYQQLDEPSEGNSITNNNLQNVQFQSTQGSGSSGSPIAPEFPKRRTRSSSFSTYLSETRRASVASDINVPGGFRREFLIHKSIQRNEQPPNFLTKNFMEFLSIYGHFAGEDFRDDDERDDESDDTSDLESTNSYEEVFDEEASLLRNPRDSHPQYLGPNHVLSKQLPSFKKKDAKGTASVAKTFFLVFKSLVGSGVLFLPRAFYNGGLGFSIGALTTFGFLTFFCYLVLIKSKKALNLGSFGELGYKTYGKPLRVCILVSIIFSQIGFVATYILFTAENMMSFLSSYVDSPYLNTANIVAVQCVFVIPLVLIRNLTKLSLISLISSAFIIIGLVIIFFYSGASLLANGMGPNITNFNPNSWSMLIGVAVTSFEGIGLILPIESSMAQPEKFPMVLSVSMAVITTLFVAIGSVGYSAFGDQVKSIIILNLPQEQLAVQSILVLYSLAVFLTAPLQLFPAVKIGESLIFNQGAANANASSKSKKRKRLADSEGKLYQSSGKYNPQVKWLKNLFRATSVIFICAIAYLNADNIDKFVSFNGCFACIPLVYIYPPLIHLRAVKAKAGGLTTLDRFLCAFDYILIVVGSITLVYTTYQIVFLN